jgi:GNAT superfamily N-acetyltransferase
MTDRVTWELYGPSVQHPGISASAKCELGFATASAETLLIDAEQYGVPPDVARERVYRFSRVKATPRGCGGGSLVLAAVLAKTDELGLWTVLEATPYDRKSFVQLFSFYEKHGFKHHPDDIGVMWRPPATSPPS